GVLLRVVGAPVMASVEIQAGQPRFVSLLSREGADALGLEPGMLAVAAIKATNLSVEIPGTGPTRSTKPPHQLAVLSTPNAAAGPDRTGGEPVPPPRQPPEPGSPCSRGRGPGARSCPGGCP